MPFTSITLKMGRKSKRGRTVWGDVLAHSAILLKCLRLGDPECNLELCVRFSSEKSR